mmetsp:Transcript_33490/g.60372  ORF Transcript_33490/g.60372 Transcript_33490/m.60372 type:complete len:323 (-) Transcript_33490:46-1014(-)
MPAKTPTTSRKKMVNAALVITTVPPGTAPGDVLRVQTSQGAPQHGAPDGGPEQQAGYPQAVPAQGSASLTTLQRSNRHVLGIIDQPVYKPLKDFLRAFTPEKTCSEYLVDDVPRSFKQFVPGSEQHLPLLVDEAGKVTESKLQFVSPPGGDAKLAFALVCYSLDLRPFGIPQEHNFSDIVNKILQKRDAKLLKGLEGYLHYFFKAIDELPKMPQKEFYRGLPADALPIFRANCTFGTRVHWSGITSVSGSLTLAQDFVGPGGIIIKIRERSVKSIKAYSAFPEDEEAILLPNWEVTIMEEATMNADGYYYIELWEKARKFVV